MAFDVYPTPQTAPFTIPAGATSPLIPFTERADATLNPDMTIRLVMLGNGCAPPPGGTPDPTVYLKAGTGGETEVAAAPFLSTVYDTPGTTTPVADVRIAPEAGNVYRIDVFISAPGSTWQLKIRNNDAVARGFTWVVASSDAESRQPWMDVTPATVTLQALTNQALVQAVQISNKGTGDLTISNAIGALGGGFALTTIPAAIPPNDCDTIALSFLSVAAGPSGPVTLAVTGNDTTSQVGGSHNRQVVLNANTGKVEVGFMLDGSGSMELAPSGQNVPLSQSRWAKLKMSTKECLDLLAFFGGGMGRFAVGVFPDIINAGVPSPSSADFQPPTDITPVAIANAKNSLDLHDPIWGLGTPIGKGIQRAIGGTAATFGYFESGLNSLNFNRRRLVLMSDGAHNVDPPPPSAFYPGVAAPGLSFTDKHVRCLTVGYGDPSAPTAWEVDHVLLSAIATQSGGLFHFSGTNNDGLDLAKAFRDTLTAGLTLNPIIDPPVTLTAAAPDFRREITILPYDTKVSFVVDWATDNRPVSVTLVTPLCEVITAGNIPIGAVFNSHPRYQIFSFDSAFLRNAANPATPRFGAWKLIVSAPGLASPERVDYGVITESRLRLALTADRSRFFAGDAYRLDATLTLDGLPVRDASVILTMKRPGQSVDKVIAATSLTRAELTATAAKFAGRELTTKGLRIATLLDKGIRFGGFIRPEAITMADANGTGVYSATITDTATIGPYEFSVIATGETPDGVPFRREQRLHALVEVKPDPGFTLVDMRFVRKLQRITAVIRVYPRDQFGNPLIVDPALDPTFQFTVKGAELLTPIQHGADGRYERTIEYGADAKPTIRIETGGIDLVPGLQPARVAALQYVDEVREFKKGGEAGRGANKHGSARDALGDVTTKKPDQFLALGDGGSVVVTVKGGTVRAAGMEDLTVFIRADEDLRPYRVEALAEGRAEKWVLLGTSPGVTRSFSLAKAGMKAATAIRITDESRRTRNADLHALDAPGVNLAGVGVTKVVRKGGLVRTPASKAGRTAAKRPRAARVR